MVVSGVMACTVGSCSVGALASAPGLGKKVLPFRRPGAQWHDAAFCSTMWSRHAELPPLCSAGRRFPPACRCGAARPSASRPMPVLSPQVWTPTAGKATASRSACQSQSTWPISELLLCQDSHLAYYFRRAAKLAPVVTNLELLEARFEHRNA